MKTTRFIAVAALAAGPMLGCTRESSHGPVQWTASNPSSADGQTAAQAWSRSTASDAPEPKQRPLPPSVPAGAQGSTAQVPPCERETHTGVTNAQPAATRWPYDRATLQLGPTPP